ncbi:eukaryotic translation initiation factor 3 k subunit [Tribonema minus]|uniref:Eukaryotic translation initiation factor 3 k subunit n=1 Tax=Tribonema minus TaxID=303371 RepID=A0A835Z1S6_9STRA|nr:eukaryotic translation initiation factor 3 k subunit [Tribonema minus]
MVQPMQLPARHAAMRPVVEHEYFDHRVVPQLEAYLAEQASSGTYDFEANKALLKLYQFFPDLVKADMVALAAGKALMALPAPDFAALSYLAPAAALAAEPLTSLARALDALEGARYGAFWAVTREPEAAALIQRLPGFADQARRVALSALAATFQSVPLSALEEAVALSGAELEAFVGGLGGEVKLGDGRAAFARNEFNQMQPKRFKESVEFEKVLKAVGTLSG